MQELITSIEELILDAQSERHGKEVLDEATKQAKIKAGSINEKKE